MELQSGQSLYSYCANISTEDAYSLVLMRGITGMVCFGICLLSLVLEILSRVWHHNGSTTLQRFFIYVIVANLLRAAFLSMDIFSHRNNGLDVDDNFCEAIGFLSQYFASFQLLSIVTMMLVFLHNLLSVNQRYKHFCSTIKPERVVCAEVTVVAVLFLLPALFVWVPFVVGNGLYGDSGPWCWLKTFDDNCTAIGATFILETAFWNIPFGLVLLFCFVCVTLYLVFFLYVGCCRAVFNKKISSILVDTFILFLFFTFYTSLCIVELSALMFVHLHKAGSSYPFLVMYAITLPVGEISLSMTSFVQFFRISCKNRKILRKAKELIPRGLPSILSFNSTLKASTRVSAKSNTSQQHRPDFLSPSTDCTSLIPDSKRGAKHTDYGTLNS